VDAEKKTKSETNPNVRPPADLGPALLDLVAVLSTLELARRGFAEASR